MAEEPLFHRDGGAVKSLPCSPQVVLALLACFNRGSTASASLALALGSDPALCLRYLAAHGGPGRLPGWSLESIAGSEPELIRSLALSSAARFVLSGAERDWEAAVERLRRHANLCAALTRRIATALGYHDPEEAHLAGLLHDVGRLRLFGRAQKDYWDLLALEGNPAETLAMEAAMLGSDHAQAGSELIAGLGWDSFLDDALLHHHRPVSELVHAEGLVKITAAAEMLLTGPQAQEPAAAARVAELLGFDVSQVQAWLADARHADAERERALLALAGVGINPEASGEEQLAGFGRVRATLRDEFHSAIVADGVRDYLDSFPEEGGLLEGLRATARGLLGALELYVFTTTAGDGVLKGRQLSGQSKRVARLSLSVAGLGAPASRALGSDVPALAGPGDSFSVSERQLMRLAGARSLLYLPLRFMGNALGLMVAPLQEEPAVLDVSMLGAFARACGTALGRARALRARNDDMERSMLGDWQARARRVLHEANNPLGIIRNYLQIADDKLSEEHPARRDLRVLDEEIERVARILQGLTQSSAAGTPISGEVDLNALASELLEFCGQALLVPQGVNVEITLDPRLPRVRGDAHGLRQALLNAVRNAVEAMPGGGTLTVETCAHVNLDGTEYVMLRLSDSGGGVAPEVMNRLFEPAMTTKGAGHSGLGLAHIRRVAQQHGGLVSVRSSQGSGTTMELLLPRNVTAAEEE